MNRWFRPARWFAPGVSATRPASPGAVRQEAKAAEASPRRLEPAIKDVVFVHIPKTAGTSMRNMLSEALPDAVKIFDYGTDTAGLVPAPLTDQEAVEGRANVTALSGTVIDAFASDIQSSEKIATLRGEAPRTQRFLVSSHRHLQHWRGAFHPASVVTFLRDPVDRVVSNYRMYVRENKFTGSLTEFCESADQINVQSRQLCGTALRSLGFVGLFEFMPDMLKALSSHLGVELAMRHDNNVRRFLRGGIDATTRSRILALNEDDLCLYDHVKANLDYFTNHRERGLDISSRLARGKVYRMGEGVLRGWALAHDPNSLATIEVRVGGQLVQRSYADQFLPWLKKATPHGVGGFEVRLPPGLAAGKSRVRVTIAGTEKDLEGSPLSP